VRGIVELFRLVNREKERHREILAFSISHDHETTFYRHPIRKFDFTELDGKEKWTSYTFTHECLQYMDAGSLENNLFGY
jgi:hypothetical protein